VTQSLPELELLELLELLVGAGVLAGAAGADELLESLLDDGAGLEFDDGELSGEPGLEDELEPLRLSVL